MRRILTQVAHAAIRTRGSVFESVFKRQVPRLGFNKAIWAIAHRLCRAIWKVLHDAVPYLNPVKRSPEAERRRAHRLLQQLRLMGYDVTVNSPLVQPS